MMEHSSTPQALKQPVIANAEDGLVILDGPDGVAITMTADAARQTGKNLIAAAGIAAQQIAGRGQREP